MPVYGYQRAVINPEFWLLEMREISFALSPADLRRVASFLRHSADRIEFGDWRSDHAHIDEFDFRWRQDHSGLDVIVSHDLLKDVQK